MCEKRIYTCMCNLVTKLYSRKLTEHCKPAIMKKKIILYIYMYKEIYSCVHGMRRVSKGVNMLF